MKITKDDKGNIIFVEADLGYCDGVPVAVLADMGGEVPPEACEFVLEWLLEAVDRILETDKCSWAGGPGRRVLSSHRLDWRSK